MIIAILAVTGGLLLRSQFALRDSQPEAAAANKGAEKIMAASLPDLQGTNQPISQWKGNVLVVNFWATWCEPCREEIPEFINLQQRFSSQGLVFIGIAVDQKEKVAVFSKEMGINYPVLVGGMNAMALANAAGNFQGALPFTVVIDRSGKITDTRLGRLSQSKLESMLKPLL